MNLFKFGLFYADRWALLKSSVALLLGLNFALPFSPQDYARRLVAAAAALVFAINYFLYTTKRYNLLRLLALAWIFAFSCWLWMISRDAATIRFSPH